MNQPGTLEQRIQKLEEENLKLRAEAAELERKLQEQSRQITNLELLIGQNPGLVAYQLIMDMDNNPRVARGVSFVSSNFRAVTGIEDPMDMNSWWDSVHPDDVQVIIEAQTQALQTGKLQMVVRKFHSEKKEWRWFQVHATGSGDKNNKNHFINGMMMDITEFKRNESRLLAYQESLRSLNQQVIRAEEAERRRIAEALHDDVGQDLALILFKLKEAYEGCTPSESNGIEMVSVLEQAIDKTRSLTRELCPTVLYQLGLAAGLEWLTERFYTNYGINIHLEIKCDLSLLAEETSTLLFRIMSELLNNIAKHAEAEEAHILFVQHSNELRCEVSDDGNGFIYKPDIQPEIQGFGLFMIAERLQSRGGRLEIETNIGQGAKVSLVLPISN